MIRTVTVSTDGTTRGFTTALETHEGLITFKYFRTPEATLSYLIANGAKLEDAALAIHELHSQHTQ